MNAVDRFDDYLSRVDTATLVQLLYIEVVPRLRSADTILFAKTMSRILRSMVQGELDQRLGTKAA